MLLREPFIWMLVTAVMGYLIGQRKGMPRVGFLLGLLLGPIGWGITIMLPSQIVKPKGLDSVCPRCNKRVSKQDKACAYCGNVLFPIEYEVEEKKEEEKNVDGKT